MDRANECASTEPVAQLQEAEAQAQLQRAAFLFERARYEDALDAAQQALHLTESAQKIMQAKCLTRIGAVHTACKRYAQATRSLRDAIAVCPDLVEALRGLAFVLSASDPINFPEALEHLRRARELEPDNRDVVSALATLLTDVGVRLKHAGLPANAISHYNEAVKVSPTYSQAYYNLGVAYADSGRLDEAVTAYKKCIEMHSGHVEAWCNLGVIHKNAARLELAMECYNKALQSNPNFELAKRNLSVALCENGTVRKEAGDRKAGKACYKRAIALCPNHADAHYNLGVAYVEEGKLERALASYSLAIHFNNNLTEAHNNLGVVHKDLGNIEKAMECYKNALAVDHRHHQTHNNIAVGYTLMGNTQLATEHLKKAVELCPTYAEAHNNYGVLLRDEGDIDGAIKAYDACINLDPRADMAAQNRLHALNYSDYWSKEDVYKEHQKWGDAYQARIDAEVAACAKKDTTNVMAAKVLANAKTPPAPCPKTKRGPGTGRPLRVAYISPDFFTHSVSYFAEVLLANHSEDAVTVFAYANVAQTDAKTERLKSYSSVKDRWRNIWGMSSVQVAELIINDDIDILVELTGHTANNRLDVMALRLAPVQVSWIGYPNTTGLSTIHYRVVDATVDPPLTTQKFAEKLYRLPGSFLCYTPSVDAPTEVADPPSERSGGIITFGSFNVLPKCQAHTLRVWAQILNAVPDSRLLIKAKPLGSQKAKAKLQARFEQLGIQSDRLDLVPLIPATKSHLQAYANIDVALDPFPYAGTTTTCEALYMGVPVISMGVTPDNGDHAHNVGATLLTAVGHPELIAYSDDEYVTKAVELAKDLNRLKRIRQKLRSDMMNSPLGLAKRYTRNVEQMFCDMWTQRGGKTREQISQVPNTKILDAKRAETSQDDAGSSKEKKPRFFVLQDNTPVAVK